MQPLQGRGCHRASRSFGLAAREECPRVFTDCRAWLCDSGFSLLSLRPRVGFIGRSFRTQGLLRPPVQRRAAHRRWSEAKCKNLSSCTSSSHCGKLVETCQMRFTHAPFGVRNKCAPTLRSIGPPPAWPASQLRVSFRLAGQSGSGPLTSNVRPHVNTKSANTFFGAFGRIGAEFERWQVVVSLRVQTVGPGWCQHGTSAPPQTCKFE